MNLHINKNSFILASTDSGPLRFWRSVVLWYHPKPVQHLIFIFILLFLNSCIEKFIPEINESQELIVVEGLITDQSGPNTIKLSKSLPMGRKSAAKPMVGCIVNISDDLGNSYDLNETIAGTYITNQATFKGEIGRTYTLQFSRFSGKRKISYESSPMEMKPVPPIDSIYYEKNVIKESHDGWFGIDDCHIFLDTHDPQNNCKFYRWSYSETWILRLLFPVQNMKCWIISNSDLVDIKKTSVIKEDRITRHPVTYISNLTDRLKIRYSILVNQYSLSEDEFIYWEKVQKIVDQVGGLYDIIPATIPSNISCIDIPDERVLGYFSVSASSSKRIYIQDKFSGIADQYSDCNADTIYGNYDPPELNVSAWTLIDHPEGPGSRQRVLTHRKECADCTTRGTTIKPDFWKDDK